jgi:hypothetical protein
VSITIEGDEVTVESRRDHAGNSSNHDRDITVAGAASGHVGIFVTDREAKTTHWHNISRQAAENLMLALDVILSDGR